MKVRVTIYKRLIALTPCLNSLAAVKYKHHKIGLLLGSTQFLYTYKQAPIFALLPSVLPHPLLLRMFFHLKFSFNLTSNPPEGGLVPLRFEFMIFALLLLMQTPSLTWRDKQSLKAPTTSPVKLGGWPVCFSCWCFTMNESSPPFLLLSTCSFPLVYKFRLVSPM